MARESPRRAPDTGLRCSSMAVGLLGDALAARAGLSYEQLLTERVLRPLGMASTSMVVPPERRHCLLAGHSRRRHPRPAIEDFLAAAGSPGVLASFAGFAPDRGSAAVVLSNTLRGVHDLGLRLVGARPAPVGQHAGG